MAAPPRAAASDNDHAHSAVEAGDIRPLQKILAAVRIQVPGRMLDARLQQNSRVYEVIVSSVIACGPLERDTRTARATAAGRLLKLTALEYRLLAYLSHHQDAASTRPMPSMRVRRSIRPLSISLTAAGRSPAEKRPRSGERD